MNAWVESPKISVMSITAPPPGGRSWNADYLSYFFTSGQRDNAIGWNASLPGSTALML